MRLPRVRSYYDDQRLDVPVLVFTVRSAGTRFAVPVVHVSRETLNGVSSKRGPLDRVESRERRKRRMRLRKRRGWR